MLERYLDIQDFVRIPLTANRYCMSLKGEVRGIDGNVIPQTINEDGDLQIWGNLYNGWRFYKVGVLSALTFKNSIIPFSVWNRLSVLFIDKNKQNTHPNNIIWKFPKGGLEHPSYPGFNIIPGFTRYSINKDGDIINNHNGQKLMLKVSDGYYRVNVTPDVGKNQSNHRHRMLALAWLEYSENVNNLDVNHINGIRGSDEIENLEWVTRQQNCEHAYSTGLRTDNHPLVMRNCITGEEKEFYSYEDCGRFLKLDGETIRLRLKNKEQPIWPGYLQFKLKKDNVPWREIIDPIHELNNRGKIMVSIKVRNIHTGKINIYSSTNEASRDLNISNATILWQLRQRENNRFPHRGYNFKFENDLSEWPSYTEEELERSKHVPCLSLKAVKLTNEQTHEVLNFHSFKHAAEYLKVSTGFVSTWCRKNKPIRGYKITSY